MTSLADRDLPAINTDELLTPPDSLTVLVARRGQRMAKRWLGSGEIEGYDTTASRFDAVEWPVRDLRGLGASLRYMQGQPHLYCVRGGLVGAEPHVTRGGTRVVIRKNIPRWSSEKNHGDAITLRPRASRVLPVDLDGQTVPDGMDLIADPAKVVRECVSRLHPAFRGAGYFWQLSGSAGHPTKTEARKFSMHLTFFTDSPVNDDQCKTIQFGLDVDDKIYEPGQPIYTADPVIAEDQTDPLAGRRSGLVEGPPVCVSELDFTREPKRAAKKAPNPVARWAADVVARHEPDLSSGDNSKHAAMLSTCTHIASDAHERGIDRVAAHAAVWPLLRAALERHPAPVKDWEHAEGLLASAFENAYSREPGDYLPRAANELTADGLAQRFANMCRDTARFVTGHGWFVRSPDGWIEVEQPALQISAMLHGLEAELSDDKAQKLIRAARNTRIGAIATLARSNPVIHATVRYDLAAQRTELIGDVILIAPSPIRAELKPARSAEVERYLINLAGARLDHVLDWLACAPDLRKPLPALYLHSASGVGKGTLACAVARLWTEAGPVDAKKAASKFNGDTLRCPVVFADEALPKDARGRPDTTWVRETTGTDKHAIERKGREVVMATGCLRLILAANNSDMFDLTGQDLTPEDLEAIAARVIEVESDDNTPKLSPELGKRFATSDEFAQHTLWLAATRKVVPGARMACRASADGLVRRASTSNGIRAAVLEHIARAVLEPSEQYGFRDGGEPGVRVLERKVIVNAAQISEQWQAFNLFNQKPSTSRVQRELRTLLSPENEVKPQPIVEGRPRREYRVVKLDLLREWMTDHGLNVAENGTDSLAAALECGSQPMPRRKHSLRSVRPS